MNFKEFEQLDENIIAILNPLIGAGRNGQHAPFTAADMLAALNKANLDKHPEKIKKAIDMLDVLITYVTTLSDGKASITLTGIEDVKKKLIGALQEITK